MDEKDLIEIDGDIEDIDNYEEDECVCNCGGVDSPEELMEYISVQEEQKRIEIQDNPQSCIPDDYITDPLVEEMMKKIYIIGEGFQTLLGYGVDYNNALAISSNLITSMEETQRVKVQNEVNEQTL